MAVVLNGSPWDSALAQYSAKNVILPQDRVILVRCLTENLNKKTTEELQQERAYLRELGWHKFKQTNVTVAVEVIQAHTKILCEFIEEKAIDLLIMTRSDSNKLTRSIKKGMITSYDRSSFIAQSMCHSSRFHIDVLVPL